MKYSIKRQMMTVFVGLILFMIVVFMIVNGSFLEKYYISNKKSEFIKAYTMVQEGVENGTIDSETPEKDLGRFTEKNNISIAVIDSEYNVVYTNVREKQMMVVQLFGYLYDKSHQEVLEKTDSYDICKSVDPQNNTEYLTMWGNFDNGDIFIMRSPLESIRSAVTIFNRFIGVVGGCVILVSVLLAWYFSKRITEPIMELATLSQKMADLDFDAKYTSGGSNEIGVLGENFNRMSERLEKTISNLKEANYKLQKDIEQKEKLHVQPLIYPKERLIFARNLCAGYPGGGNVIRNLNFELLRGERVFLHGKNGCGKSTLLHLIRNLAEETGNRMQDHREIETRSGLLTVGAGLTISYISQDTGFLSGTLSEYCRTEKLDYSLLLTLLRKLDFERTQFEKPMESFSEGQKKKVLLAASLATPAHLYIWDEPLNYIDVFSRMQIETLLLEYQPTMLFVEHDAGFCRRIATKTIRLDG